MDRNLIIEWLAHEFTEAVRCGGNRELLEAMLQQGFSGYCSFSDEELLDEVSRLGLVDESGTDDADIAIEADDSAGQDFESPIVQRLAHSSRLLADDAACDPSTDPFSGLSI